MALLGIMVGMTLGTMDDFNSKGPKPGPYYKPATRKHYQRRLAIAESSKQPGIAIQRREDPTKRIFISRPKYD